MAGTKNMYDHLIKNGSVIDGTGSSATPADVAIACGKIAAIGRDIPAACAAHTIDAAGKSVAPGFIDIHRHGDMAAFRAGFGELELKQGLTTIVNGNCGMSAAPVDQANAALAGYLAPVVGSLDPAVDTSSFAAYIQSLEGVKLPINCGMLCGSGVMRAGLWGLGAPDGDAQKRKLLCAAIDEALNAGALGVSLGLGYAPECFCDTQELLSGLAPLKNGNIPAVFHMREEGDGVACAVREVIEIGRALNAPVHISHLKAMGRRNWNDKIPEALTLISRAAAEGLDISCDVYPYTAGSTQLMHVLPPDFIEGGAKSIISRLKSPAKRRELKERIASGRGFDNIAGMVGWENIFIASLNTQNNKRFEGMSISDIANQRNESPVDCLCDMLIEENCAITMIDFITCEEDIARILTYPHTSVISDSIYPVTGRPHPRLYGTFARVFEKYVYQTKALSLEEAVRRVTANPAAALRLKGKGLLKVGMDADINVFDPAKIRERATYDSPAQCSEGMDFVFVNGALALEFGRLTGAASGKTALRKQIS